MSISTFAGRFRRRAPGPARNARERDHADRHHVVRLVLRRQEHAGGVHQSVKIRQVDRENRLVDWPTAGRFVRTANFEDLTRKAEWRVHDFSLGG